MKIKKIFIKNFKGIKEKKIIKLSNKTTLLTGPNGFGKTTIYDVIELCLTGEIHRTITKKDVTSDRRDYKKPFYQNIQEKEVLIKLWLQNKKQDLIIIKYLPPDKNEINYDGRKNKPTDFNILKTYKENNSDNFEDENLNPNNLQILKQNEITKFFNLSDIKCEIENIYRLFNYLQQEETTYFLKKSEKERKDDLGFLFQTQEQERKSKNISSHCSNFEKIKNELNKEIEKLDSEQASSIPYIQLFKDKKIDFDQELLFQDMTWEEAKRKRDAYRENINNLINFQSEFSPAEYTKRKNTEKITKYLKHNDSFIKFYLLQNFLADEEFEKIKSIYSLVENENTLQYFILQNFVPNYLNIIKVNKYLDLMEEYNTLDKYEKRLSKLEKMILIWNESKIDEYHQLIENRNTYLQTADAIEKTLNEILRLRNKLKENFDTSSQKDNQCPYCGHDWENEKNLDHNFKKREKALRKLLSSQSNKLEGIEKEINKSFMIPIKEYIEEFQEANKKTDPRFLSILRKLQNLQINWDESIFDSLQNYIWKELKSIDNLDQDVNQIKDGIKTNATISLEVFELIKELRGKSFNNQMKLLDEFQLSGKLSKHIFPLEEKMVDINLVDTNKQDIINSLDEELLNHKYDESRSIDKNKLYERYFSSTNEKFTKHSKEDFIGKISYINSQLQSKEIKLLEAFKRRKSKVDKVVEKLEQLKKIYVHEIKSYKVNMAEKIKIPFFLYTAKILQTYQQGLGIFLNTDEKTAAIRFLTATDSDHDVMHHLSSGQLAVVSLAFCLAINKTYNISPNLKILAIDDPIQEMDALNIHSFIELIKNEFIEDYQLIFSTHNDMNAMYMKYKIENMHEDSVKVVNVQRAFFENKYDAI